MELQFMVRILSTKRDSETHKERGLVHIGRENALKLPPDQRPTPTDILLEAATTWLTRENKQGTRCQRNGFSVDTNSLCIRGYSTPRLKKGSIEQPLEYLDIQGTLTIEDVELFRKALINGLGGGRAFGCGLMMIRKVQ
jgi:CRISPR system Cascade subunit CasE